MSKKKREITFGTIKQIANDNSKRWGDIRNLLGAIETVTMPLDSWLLVHVDTRDMRGIVRALDDDEIILPDDYENIASLVGVSSCPNVIKTHEQYQLSVEELEKFIDLQKEHAWEWIYNSRFKYTRFYVDLGNPGIFYITDRYEDQIIPSELFFQHGR